MCYTSTVLIQTVQLKRGDNMVKIDYKSSKPLHEQISMGIKELIIGDVLKKDEQLPSVRDMSVSLTVNPNTVQRAYRTLESEGVIYSIRGKGNFVSGVVSADPKHIENLYDALCAAVKELCFLGEDRKNVLNVIENIYNERNG